MNEALKQFSADLLKDFQAALVKNQKDVAKIKASDGGTFKVVISTSDEDRQGDALDQSKWKLENYKQNPVVLWAHDYYNPPIAICTGIKVEGGKLVAEGKFAPAELNPFASQIAGLYEAGYINTTSVGYMQHEDGDLELLEFSFVPVPANPYALSLRESKKLNLDMASLVMKGLSFTTKGAVPFKSHGIVDDIDATWDGPAQVKACGDDLDKLKSICTWFDSENNEKKSAYKLPHHRAEDMKAVWKGVAAAMGALMGSRGGVDIPEGDRKATYSHLAKHYKEFGKEAPDYEKAVELFQILKKSPELLDTVSKSPQIGDHCELDDGTPGVLAEDSDNPGEMVCVPAGGDKSKFEAMNKELIKNITAEHTRHGEAVGKAIDEFSEKCMGGAEKAIEEYKGEMDTEQDSHLEKCMKAIDEGYELEDQKKAIDEFKSEMKAEHLNHVKACDKAIEEFKSAFPEDGEDKDKEKAIEEYTKAIGTELERHKAAHMEMCKAEMGEGEDDGKGEKTIVKAGRVISAKTQEKIDAIVKSIEEFHAKHSADHEEFTNKAIAALKELTAQPEGDEGKETSDEKSATPNSRSRISGANGGRKSSSEELEAYLLGQRLVRQIKTVSETGLRQLNEKLEKLYPRK